MLKEECVSGTEYFKGAFGISQNIKPDSLKIVYDNVNLTKIHSSCVSSSERFT